MMMIMMMVVVAAHRGIGTVAFRKSAHYHEIASMVNMRFVAFPFPARWTSLMTNC
ncbi:MAG TPA: hypothetical protein VHA09_07480 [Nitrososphaera sp.]|nr:hypothetical protein [Nitrososphaera sp.]